jgi:hypothetical protein
MHGLSLKCLLLNGKASSNAMGRDVLCENLLEQSSSGLELALEQKW